MGIEKSEVYRSVVTGSWFSPRTGSYVSAESIGTKLLQHTEDEIEEVLLRLSERGLLLDCQNSLAPGRYNTTQEVWRLRESFLRQDRRRLSCLLYQKENDLQKLITALLMAGSIENRRSPFFGKREGLTMQELSVYLSDYEQHELDKACRELKNNGFIQFGSMIISGSSFEIVSLADRGRRYYQTDVRAALGLGDGQSILDLVERTAIEIFWAWQSDFGRSRNQIGDVLKQVTKKGNKEWNLVAPLKITEAVDTGDGAIRIDVALQEKIGRSDFFVADLTPILIQNNRLYPNPNVLVEVGFALAGKDPEQVFLVELERQRDEIPGYDGKDAQYPFDISHIHRFRYSKPADLKDRLLRELRPRLTWSGLLVGESPE